MLYKTTSFNELIKCGKIHVITKNFQENLIISDTKIFHLNYKFISKTTVLFIMIIFFYNIYSVLRKKLHDTTYKLIK
jgi:hypothetical protein